MGEIADMIRSDVAAVRKAGSFALREIADGHLLSVQNRLNKGIGSNGRAFTPYAQSTARKKGRRSPVTMRESGRTRSSMYIRRIRLDRYELRFRDRKSERKARWFEGGTRRRTRSDQRQRTPGRVRAGVVFRNTGGFKNPPRPFISATRRELREFDRTFGIVFEREFPSDLRRNFKTTFTI